MDDDDIPDRWDEDDEEEEDSNDPPETLTQETLVVPLEQNVGKGNVAVEQKAEQTAVADEQTAAVSTGPVFCSCGKKVPKKCPMKCCGNCCTNEGIQSLGSVIVYFF